MREVNLKPYQWTRKGSANTREGGLEPFEITLPYDVKTSLLNVMFNPALQLKGAELVRQNILAIKIERAGDTVILEEEEYNRIRRAVEVYPAQSRADVEFVDRILNHTPKIES